MAVGFARVAHGVKTLVELVPAVTGAVLAQAPAAFMRCGLVGAAEVAGKILFAREIGAPWRHACGAVVEGAQRQPALRVGGGFHQRVPCGRTADGERCVGREAPRVRRWAHCVPAAALEFDLGDRHAVRSLAFAHLLGRPGSQAAHMQQSVVGVLVVHHEQAAAAAVERVVVHAVVMHAQLRRLFGGGVGRVVLECRHVARQPHWIAPRQEGRGGVALGHDHSVGSGCGHAFEAQLGAAGGHDGAARHWR